MQLRGLQESQDFSCLKLGRRYLSLQKEEEQEKEGRNPDGSERVSLEPDAHLVEDVEASLSWVSCDNTGFFQQEVGNFPTIWFTAGAELDFEVLPLPENQSAAFTHMHVTHTRNVYASPSAHRHVNPVLREIGQSCLCVGGELYV